ncbi:MAG: hypothetical protein KDK71_08035, partial [Chlamydiia bacterium]|nr:hypothetical protein [Chlamydiia bacterium]
QACGALRKFSLRDNPLNTFSQQATGNISLKDLKIDKRNSLALKFFIYKQNLQKEQKVNQSSESPHMLN